MEHSSRLGRRFFQRYTPAVARGLLGCRLVRVVGGRRLSGVIVETEAYRGRGDPASHAYPGRTARNAVMFGEAGHAYVYFSYGFHYCLNVTTEGTGRPGAVLFRALEPLEGVQEMVENRGVEGEGHTADGPGKLTQALRIDRSLNGEDLVTSKRLFIELGTKPPRIRRSERIGISRGTERKWRFYVADNKFVSSGNPPLPAHRIHNYAGTRRQRRGVVG
jgi:DNA-3-methyladenine glycosylase